MQATVQLRRAAKPHPGKKPHNPLLLVVRGGFIDHRGIAVRSDSIGGRACRLRLYHGNAAGISSYQLQNQLQSQTPSLSANADANTSSSSAANSDNVYEEEEDRDNIADDTMADNSQSSGGAANSGGRPDHVSPADWHTYQTERAQLKQALIHRANLRRQLGTKEGTILSLETGYLESTPIGNIITGFDNYIKGTTSAAAQRRRTGPIDQNRVFSRSSISYNALNSEASETTSSTSTPGAPTPLSTTFTGKDKDGGSNQPTPTSATEKKGPGAKKKKARAATTAAAAAAAAAADGDSETDTPRDTKKVRTHFGARK